MPANAQTAPKFAVDASWPKELPKDWITGQLGGVCTAEQDHIYVVNRRNITDEEKETSISAPSIIKFDMEGNVVGSWGDQNTVPNSIHGCFVDQDKNVCVAGNSDGIVQKYAPDGKLLLQIGTAESSTRSTARGAARATIPRRTSSTCLRASWSIRAMATSTSPTATATAASRCSTRPGNSCGSGDARRPRRKPRRMSPGVFAEVVHCIAMSNAGLIYVCDRQGNRVQVFEKDGTFVRNIPIPNRSGKLPDKRGTAWWVAFSPDREQKFST